MRPVPRDLAELRLKAEAAARAEDWGTVASYADELRARDRDWWPHLWAPLAAVAAHRTGGDPTPLLEEAVAGGFCQPGLLDLDTQLGDLPGWSRWASRMSAPALPPSIEVARWPTVSPSPDLVLDRLPEDREAQLRERLLAPSPDSWTSARALLEWATTRWEHANDHVDSHDALEVLDRAAAGERFACVEYSVLLSQALNAIGIPARRVSLGMRDQHVGFARGHVVSEAWIDALGRWVVLDGQNGGWWGTDDEPLGLRDLQRLERSGDPRPAMCLTVRAVSVADQDQWWEYFHAASSSGLEWTSSFVPLFQGEPVSVRLVVPEDAATHPDLAEIATGAVDVGEPALLFTPAHPFATGVEVEGRSSAVGEPFRLESLGPGTHELEVRTVTPYGRLRAQPLRVIRR